MEQNTKKSRRRMLRITAFALATLFFLMSCKKDKKDDTELLLLAAALNGPNGTATFNFSNTNGLLAARTQDSSHFFTLPDSIGQGSGFLTDLGGEDPQAYGDGAGDGFNDKFLTPEAVGIQVCQIVAYKSVAKGGPARGSETLENANFVVFTPALALGLMSFLIPNYGPCSSYLTAGLTNTQGIETRGLPIRQIPESEKADYDRIGIVARSFSYYFKPSDVPENAYRYVDLVLNNPQIPGIPNPLGIASRGDVSTELYYKDCPSAFITSPSVIFPMQLLKPEDFKPGCGMSEGYVDSSSGSFINGLGSPKPFTNPSDYLNPPTAGTVSADNSLKLKFKLPAAANSLDAKAPYILISDLNPSKGAEGNLLFNVSVDKVLFWDSTAGDNVFSPQTDAADRPNATSGSDNLTNTARKNLIFHLPTILSQTK
ncbi:hypothetical protein EHQ76_09920 [Leptospira barantonii]|uniref:Lipoprotein n=1 Tax=Leptospira barantonii TaxID=2023184 RepID=A0A5F2BD76_9LEPT|nr:hypothetical protein [Leptospira barantonii]TGM03516.1 hypothetical protein EHQ76_09920 [Leptospira barantonii]